MILPLIIIALSLIIAGIFIAFILTYMNAHKLIIRDPMRSNQYVREYLMIEKTDKKTQARRWISVWWQPKYKCERPPAEALNTRKRGKYFAECYLVAEGQHCWITDKGINIIEETNEQGAKEWVIVDPTVIDEEGQPLKIDTFRPYTITQRHTMISQHQKELEISKNKGWTAERITQMAAIGVLGMVVIVAIIMGGEFWEGLNKAQDKNLEFQDKQAEMLDKIAIISQNVGVKLDNLETTVAQKPKSQTGEVIETGGEEPPNERDND